MKNEKRAVNKQIADNNILLKRKITLIQMNCF